MKFKAPQLSSVGEMQQSLAAMTDVVFQLLIFFIVTMGTYVETTSLEAALPPPNANGGKIEGIGYAVKVEVTSFTESDRTPIYMVNNVPHTPTQLGETLHRLGELTPDIKVMIKCAPDSAHGLLVYLLSQCAQNKLENIKLMKPDAPVQTASR